MTRWPAVWIATLGSTLLGVIVGALSDFVFNGSTAENLGNGLIGAALGILFSDLLERARLDSANALIADLRGDDDLMGLVKNARQARASVKTIRNDPVRDFFKDRFNELCDEKPWVALAQGRLDIAEHSELSFNRDAALRICVRSIRAVAYQDEGFWSLPEGRAFLAANRKIIESGREITRIFVFESQISAADRAQMESQSKLGIKVRVLPPTSVGDHDKLDFVLYDAVAVRVAEPVIGKRKRATLHIDEREVRSFVERFSNLEERSLTIEDYLAGAGQ